MTETNAYDDSPTRCIVCGKGVRVHARDAPDDSAEPRQFVHFGCADEVGSFALDEMAGRQGLRADG